MEATLDKLTGRFDRLLLMLAKTLGPELITQFPGTLTAAQFSLLHVLQQMDTPCTVSTLASTLDVTPSAITGMLDRMADQGFVTRTRDTNDRRLVYVALTKAGQDILNSLLHMRQRVIEHCLTQLDREALAAFMDTLEALGTIAQTLDVDALIESSNPETEP